MSCDLPKRAADRIVLNPHSFPHPPNQLERLVARNHHQEHLSHLAQDAYNRRRGHWEAKRTERNALLRSASSSEDTDGAIVSDPEDDDPATIKSPRARGHQRHRSIYEAPFVVELPEIAQKQQMTSRLMPMDALRPPVALFSSLNTISNPEEKLRMRCLGSKALRSGIWARRASSDDTEMYSVWHVRLRDTYKSQGQDLDWRTERDRVLQESRRERRFKDLMIRRRTEPSRERPTGF